MKNKTEFLKFIMTLLDSWGGDTPPEVFWGLNEMLEWYSKEYNIIIPMEFDEDGENANEIIKFLEEN